MQLVLIIIAEQEAIQRIVTFSLIFSTFDHTHTYNYLDRYNYIAMILFFITGGAKFCLFWVAKRLCKPDVNLLAHGIVAIATSSSNFSSHNVIQNQKDRAKN